MFFVVDVFLTICVSVDLKKDLIQSKLDEKCFNGSRFFEVRKKRKKVKTKKSIKTFFFFQKMDQFHVRLTFTAS